MTRRSVSFGLALGAVLGLASAAAALPTVPGDVNEDGRVSVRDAVRVVNHVLGDELLSDDLLLSAELDQDGSVTEDDVELLVENAAFVDADPLLGEGRRGDRDLAFEAALRKLASHLGRMRANAFVGDDGTGQVAPGEHPDNRCRPEKRGAAEQVKGGLGSMGRGGAGGQRVHGFLRVFLCREGRVPIQPKDA